MCEKNSSVLECLPITSYQDLLNFSPEIIDSSHPKKYQRSHPFKVIGEAEENCDYDFVSKDEKLNPRTLFCHDMKGGYLGKILTIKRFISNYQNMIIFLLTLFKR